MFNQLTSTSKAGFITNEMIGHHITLALIHHEGKHVNTEVISIAQELVTTGNLSKTQPSSNNVSYHSKDISELFPNNMPSFYFLLIERAPGIGKIVLSKEIAYQWAKNTLLKFKKLVFLLFLRDPGIKNLSTLESLIEYLFNNTDVASGISNYLFHTLKVKVLLSYLIFMMKCLKKTETIL